MTEAAASPPRLGIDYRWLSLGVTTIGSLMSILNMTMVNIGLPKILTTFGVDVQEGQWVLTSYMIALAVVVPVSGFLAEKIGMKRLYMITMALFVVGSVLCGFAWDLPSLILFRVLQGLGGGMLQPLGMAIVFTLVTPRERPQFMALLGLPMLVAPLLGPTVGGYLVEYVSWRTIFTVNVPVGIVGLVMAALLLRETPARRGAALDVPGFVLSSLAFPTLLLGFSYGAQDGWGAWHTQLFLAVGAVTFLGWIFVELAQDDPMLDLRLFANPIYTLATVMNFVIQLSIFGTMLLLPLLLQTAQGLGALQAGLILVPQGIASFVSMNVSGRLYNLVGPRPLVFFGVSVLAITTWEFSQLSLDTPSTFITLLATVRGFSMGFCMMPIMTASYNTVPQDKIGRATALSNSLMRVFGSFSTSFIATVLNARSRYHLHLLSASLSPTRPAFLTLVGRMQPMLTSQGRASFGLQQRAAAWLASGFVTRSSLIMAFNDVFLMLTLFALLALVFAYFISDPTLDEGSEGAGSGAARRPGSAPAIG